VNRSAIHQFRSRQFRSCPVATPSVRGLSPWLTVRDEVTGTLSALSAHLMSSATAMFADRERRWFRSGQGRSGLVAQMTAMRLMRLGFDLDHSRWSITS
jgi:hypothetical protein